MCDCLKSLNEISCLLCEKGEVREDLFHGRVFNNEFADGQIKPLRLALLVILPN